MQVVKIQDAGKRPLHGNQESYWKSNIIPKFQKYRPGFNFKYQDQESILKRYGFVAFEYGHWTTQNERYDFLASALASFSDIKRVLNFKTLGFEKIGIAYGARGQGGAAAAHFEPGSFMINLTRRYGFGSFAHEFGHALDYYFGGFIDQSKDSFSLSGGSSFVGKVNYEKPGTLRFLMIDLLQSIRYIDGGPSESYLMLSKQKAGTEYWFRSTEIFARAFEQYVHYKLRSRKITNTFLTKNKYEDSVYLTDKDFKRILPKMEKLIQALAKKQKQ